MSSINYTNAKRILSKVGYTLNEPEIETYRKACDIFYEKLKACVTYVLTHIMDYDIDWTYGYNQPLMIEDDSLYEVILEYSYKEFVFGSIQGNLVTERIEFSLETKTYTLFELLNVKSPVVRLNEYLSIPGYLVKVKICPELYPPFRFMLHTL